MSNIKLVAVEHGDSGHLVGPNMFPLIQQKVVPYLDKDSVIVAEGGKGRGVLKPQNPHYDTIYQQLGPIALSGIKPVLHSDDALYHFLKPEEALSFFAQFQDYQQATASFLSFKEMPGTWEEMIRRIRDDDHSVVITGTLSEEWCKYAEREVQITQKRDLLFAKQINRHARKNKQVFFFGGVLHCASLTAKYGWEVIRYNCPPEFIQGCYSLWYLTNRITTHLG